MRQVPGYPLWVGHVGDLRDLRAVCSAGIAAVVDLALKEAPAVVPRDLVYCRFPLLDGSGNAPWVLRAAVQAVASLLQAGVPALVFCGAGMSRSVCVAAAAIARVRGCPLAEALQLVARAGPADVSPGFLAELKAAED